MFNDLSRMGKYLGQAARMLVGMPDYDTYVEHMRNKHPDKPVSTVTGIGAWLSLATSDMRNFQKRRGPRQTEVPETGVAVARGCCVCRRV